MLLFLFLTNSQSREVDREDKKAVKEANMYYFIESGALNHFLCAQRDKMRLNEISASFQTIAGQRSPQWC